MFFNGEGSANIQKILIAEDASAMSSPTATTARLACATCARHPGFGLTVTLTRLIGDLKIRKIEDEEKGRDAFTADQLQVLFDSPVFTAG